MTEAPERIELANMIGASVDLDTETRRLRQRYGGRGALAIAHWQRWFAYLAPRDDDGKLVHLDERDRKRLFVESWAFLSRGDRRALGTRGHASGLGEFAPSIKSRRRK